MNFRILIIFSLFFYACTGSVGAGSLGGWKTAVFPVKQSKLDSVMDTFFVDSSQYNVPKKWEYESGSWKRSGYDFLKSRFFYFKDAPEEMFYVSDIASGFGVANPDWARIAIRSVYTEEMGWRKKEQYSEQEQLRIQRRFDEEIVVSFERYLNLKSYSEK